MKLPPLPSVSEVLALYKITAAKRLSQNFILEMKLNEKTVKSVDKILNCSNLKDAVDSNFKIELRVMKLPPLPSVSEVLALYKITAAKRLSQNFILEMKLNEKIVKMAGKLDGCHVVEVGPGPGGITRALLEQNIEHLHVIEKDERFIPSLKVLETRSGCMTTHLGDCLKFPMEDLFTPECKVPWEEKLPKLHIIGNLPFKVSLPLLVQYLKAISARSDVWKYGRVPMTLTFQDAIGARICAPPGFERRGRLSFDCQNLCHVSLKHMISGSSFVPPSKVDEVPVKLVPRKHGDKWRKCWYIWVWKNQYYNLILRCRSLAEGSSFVPPPKVDVALVKLVPRKKPLVDLPYKLTSKVSRQLFHNRQKYIKNTLRTLFPPNRQDLCDELLGDSELTPTRRPTNLSNEEIARLCVVYSKICDRLPYIFDYDHRSADSIEHSEIIDQVEQELNYKHDTSLSSTKDDVDIMSEKSFEEIEIDNGSLDTVIQT